MVRKFKMPPTPIKIRGTYKEAENVEAKHIYGGYDHNILLMEPLKQTRK